MRRPMMVLFALVLGAALALPATANAEPHEVTPTPAHGPESTSTEAAPAEVALQNVLHVEVGYYHSCAILTNHQVKCWGDNSEGEIGNNDAPDDALHAVTVRNAADTGPLVHVIQLALGDYHTCALLTTHQVRCWGENDDGELGTGDNDPSALPRTVRNVSDTGALSGVTQIAAESDGMCALLSNHEVRCWGEDDYGQLGNGDPLASVNLPNVVKGVGGTGVLTGIARLGYGYDNRCVMTQSGQGRCWGYAGDGALGNGHASDTTSPVRVLNAQTGAPLTGIIEIENGGYHGCALLTNHQVRCWGDNDDGELGTGGVNDNTRAVLVRGPGGGPLTGVLDVDLGVDSSCALLNTHQVRCWGDDGYGQNGDGTIESPDFRKVPNLVRNPGNTGALANVSQLAGKSYHFCVVLASGQARCWGYNNDYALGNGTTVDSPLPTGVRG